MMPECIQPWMARFAYLVSDANKGDDHGLGTQCQIWRLEKARKKGVGREAQANCE